MPSKKMNSAILAANGGLDSARALKTARNILLNHDLRQPVLYHLVLTGSQDMATYQAVIKSLVRRLRSRCRTEYFGAYEVEPEEGKGLHAHCFFIIETSKKTPFKILDVNEGEYLHKLAIRHKLVNKDGSVRRIHVSKPKNAMHGRQFFARPVGDALLANCLDWIEYEFKSRSKENVQSRETYFNSEFKANKTRREVTRRKAAPTLNPTLAKEIQNERQFETQGEAAGSSTNPEASYRNEASINDECRSSGRASENQQNQSISREGTAKGDDMQMTEAGFKYLATQYETCVDQGMNVVEIQHYLSSKGISRSLKDVKHELNNVFCFAGYAAQHPAPPLPDVAKLDAAIDRTPLRSDRWLSRVYSREPSKLSHKPSSIGLTVSEPPGNIEPPTQMSQLRSYPA